MKIVRDTPFEVGYSVFQLRPPRPSLTVVVKGTFTLQPEGVCTLAEEQLPCVGDRYLDDDPANSLSYASDLCLLKPRGECSLAGSCHPPGGGATVCTVSLRVGSVSKSVVVFGDRVWSGALGAIGAPVRFFSMPLCYERSFGGPGFDRNPVGRGLAAVPHDGGRAVLLPNLEGAGQLICTRGDRPEPAGFSPVPPGWKGRARKMGTYDQAWVDRRWPWFAEDFDPDFFNACPPDQQIKGYWRGDEEIGLDNLVAGLPHLVTRLPGLRARAFLEIERGPGGPRWQEVALNLDTIAVDAEARTAACVWRGLTDVASEQLEEVRTLFAGHEPLGARLDAAHYHHRLSLLRAEAAAEDRAFAPEPVPEIAPAGAAPPAPSPAMKKLTALIESMPKAAAGSAAPPPAPRLAQVEDAARLTALLAAVGMAAPPELGETVRKAAAPRPPPDLESLGPRPAVPLRAQVQDRLARQEPLSGMDLTGADLSELNLSGVDLAGAKLGGADLRAASLASATLDGAILSGARIGGCSFAHASLKGADLKGVEGEAAVFDEAVLADAILADARVPRSSFKRVSGAGAELARTDLSGCSFAGALLDGADLSGALLDGADFSGASLVAADLGGAKGDKTILKGCDLTRLRASGAELPSAVLGSSKAEAAVFGGARLDRADLSSMELERADFTRASLAFAVLSGSNLKRARFTGARMASARMARCNLFEGVFESADLTGADLRGSNLHGAGFWRARLTDARLDQAIITGTLLERRS